MSIGYDYEYDVPWYSHSVQVRYYPDVNSKARYGVAYHDTLMDAETGDTYSITELVNKYNSTESKEKCIVELSWCSLDDVIKNGKFFN